MFWDCRSRFRVILYTHPASPGHDETMGMAKYTWQPYKRVTYALVTSYIEGGKAPLKQGHPVSLFSPPPNSPNPVTLPARGSRERGARPRPEGEEGEAFVRFSEHLRGSEPATSAWFGQVDAGRRHTLPKSHDCTLLRPPQLKSRYVRCPCQCTSDPSTGTER